MTEPFEYEGYWWLPGEENSETPGTLTYDPQSGAELTTLGRIQEEQSLHSRTLIDIIVGISDSGKKITLFDCRDHGVKMSMPGIERHTYKTRLIAVGALHVEYPPVLKSISFQCTDLDAWVGRHGFTMSTNYDPFEVQVGYSKPDPIEANLPNDYKLRIGFSASVPGGKWPQRKVAVTEEKWIKIEASEEKEFELMWEEANRIRDFLSLAIGKAVFITNVQGTNEAAKREVRGQTYYEQVEFYAPGWPSPEGHRPVKRPDEVLLPLEAVENKLEETTSLWFEKVNLLEPVLDLYFGTLYEPTIHLQRHFLFLAQATETYHRRTSNEKNASEEDHQRRVSEIMESIPSEYESWLNGKLRHGNELSLRQRIKRLVDRHDTVFEEYIVDKHSFAHAVVVTRNYLTHYVEEMEEQASNALELLDLIYKLRTVIETSLLSEIGLEDDKIAEVLADKIEERQFVVENN